jgi:Protein of unknown function (DUF2927)
MGSSERASACAPGPGFTADRLFHLYVRDPLCIWKFYPGTITLRAYPFDGCDAVRTVQRESIEYEPRAIVTRCCELWTLVGAFGHLVARSAFIFALATIALAASVGQSSAENTEISMRRSAQQTNFTNDQIKKGFFKIAFGAELQLGPRVERIRKFDKPVRIFVVNRGTLDRRADVAAIVADIRAHVDHLDIAITDDRKIANVVVTLVHGRDLKRTIRSIFGAGPATRIQRSLSPQCLSGFAKDRLYRIQRAEVILPVDAGEFMFHDCAYEELLQSLGPINDNRSVPWTMFNDDVQMGFFDIYDQFLLNLLYDPRVRPGMTKKEVGKLLPEILPAVRAWVSRTNSPRDTGLQQVLSQ